MAACPSSGVEVHHRIPRCLLQMRDRADAHREPLSGGGLQAWLDYECEALRYSVDPDMGRDELAALIETSMVELPASEHRAIHSADFAEWGRLGGLATVRRYGTSWFSLLARRRWKRITAETLAEVFGALSGGAGGRS